MIPSPNEILYFIELTKTLNFSRASTRIGISQPSLSAAIKRLEHTLDTELFIRNQHKVIITEAGKNLLAHSKKLLQLWQSTKANCLLSEQTIQGSLIFGCHSSIALYFLPKFLPNLLAAHPKLDIQLKHDLSRHITEEVINFTIDIGIVVNPVQHPDLIIKKILNEKVTCWLSDIKPIMYDNIICDPELMQTQVILKKLEKKGIKYKKLITSSNLEVIACLTKEGLGIGILPTCIAKTVNLIPMSAAPKYDDTVCLIYRHENRNNKALAATVQTIQQYCNK